MKIGKLSVTTDFYYYAVYNIICCTSNVNNNHMNNLVMFLLDKKLLTSRFLTISPVHSAEFEELAALTSPYFAQGYIIRYRIFISDGNNYSHLILIFGKIMLVLTLFS